MEYRRAMHEIRPLPMAPRPTSPVELGTLERTDPRLVWKHEALDFTPWLRDNADRLAEALGIELEITGAEHPVGEFSLDLIGKDLTHGKPLIVENQLAPADHGHLGQLITYAAGTGAATIIWIATQIRDEYRQALTWLNEQTGEETHFFGVELEVVRIGSSRPAPLFNVVVMPNDWQKSVKAAASATISVKASLYANFWQTFLDRLQADRAGWSRVRQTTRDNWFPMSAGLPAGCRITAIFTGDGRLRNEFYIDRGTQEECKTFFDALETQKDRFEEVYGRAVFWERLDNRKASRIADYRDGTIDSVNEHATYLDWFVDAGDRLRRSLGAIDLSG